MSGFGILGTNRPTADDIADVLEGAKLGDPLSLARIQDSTNGVPSIAALRALVPTPTLTAQTTLGYYAANDGGGADFVAAPAGGPGTYIDNGGTVIVPTGGDGSSAWLLRRSGDGVDARQFGAVLGAAADRATNTEAINRAIVACGAGSFGVAVPVYLPGVFVTNGITLGRQHVHLYSTGRFGGGIDFGTAAAGVVSIAQDFLRPILRDMQVISSTGTGRAIDLSAVADQVFSGRFEYLNLESSGDCLYAPRLFSQDVIGVYTASRNGHGIVGNCGPGVTLRDCYAVECGVGKAGYRLSGVVRMDGCNGLNVGDWWGVFGQDSSATDGFQNDFAGMGDLQFDMRMINCNIENFAAKSTNGGGLLGHSAYNSWEIDGGQFHRIGPATFPYQALVRARRPSTNTREPIRVNVAMVHPGTVPPSMAQLYTDIGATFFDVSGALAYAGVTTYYAANAGLSYGVLWQRTRSAVYGDIAHEFSALDTRRVYAGTVTYREATITTVNTSADDAPTVVTGITKVLLAPATPSLYARFSFAADPGADTDFARNGDLILEAVNSNVTLHHNYGAGNGLRLRGGATRLLVQGEVVRFIRSNNFLPGISGWVEA